MKLAIVSPLPPSPTGIADYTVDVVRALARAHTIELFHDQAEVSATLPAPVFRIDDLPARASSPAGFDAVIYQMGNAPAHDFMYEWMERVRGIVVLHDLVLHAFTRRFLDSPEARAYAADPSSRDKQAASAAGLRAYLTAVEAVHPGLGERLVDAHLNSAGDLLAYAYPLFEPALEHATAAGAHNPFMVEAIRAARPDLRCVRLAMPVQPMATSPAAMAAFRERFGLKDDEAAVGCFGLVTREKRIETVARAIARIAEIHPAVRLVLAGPVAEAPWLSALLERMGVAHRTVVTGRLENAEFIAAMMISDVVVHLRYPSARETSAALLRVMAQGRPAIIADIANQSEIPEDTVRRVDPCDEEGDLARAIDWSLRNPHDARAMGERAARYTATEHSDARTLETYERLVRAV